MHLLSASYHVTTFSLPLHMSHIAKNLGSWTVARVQKRERKKDERERKSAAG